MKTIKRPTSDYDPAWKDYYAQNPHLLRSVGAAGDDNGEGEDSGEDTGDQSESEQKQEDQSESEQKGSDDKPAMSDLEAKLLQEVMDKKSKLKGLSGENEDLKAQLKRFEGIDPDAVRKALDDQKKAEERDMEKKGEWENLKTRMAEEHVKQIKTKDDEIADLKAKLESSDRASIDLKKGYSFGDSSYIREKLTLSPTKAEKLYGTHFEVEDGEVVGYDKPRGAEGRTKFVDSMGRALGFDEVMIKLVEADPDKEMLLRSGLKQGADSKPSGDAKVPKKEDNLSGIGKIAAGLKAA